jgi:hypothetical protein
MLAVFETACYLYIKWFELKISLINTLVHDTLIPSIFK